MDYIEVSIRDEYIRLGQAMKLAGILDSGSDIKYEILDGKVQVGGAASFTRETSFVTPAGIIKSYDCKIH